MTDITLGIRLTGDSTNLVGEIKVSTAELNKLAEASAQAGQRAMAARRGNDEFSSSLRRLREGLDPAVRKQRELREGTTLLDRALRRGKLTAEQHARSMALLRSRYDQTRRAAVGFGGSLSSLRTLLLATVSAETLRRTILVADGYEAAQAQIRLATRALGDYATASREVDRIADSTGVLLDDTVSIFRAIARTAPELKATQEQVLDVTEAVQQLGAISNTAPENLRAGLRQFGQAMSSQIVRAEEFNSVLENIPELAVRIAAGMGTTVGQLRLAVVEGRVLSSDVFKALLGQTEDIAADFDSLPARITRSANRVRNAFSASLAGLNEQSGLTADLAGAMDLLAENMDTVVRGVIVLSAGYATARAAALAYAAAQRVANLALTRSPLGLFVLGLGLAASAVTAITLRTDEATDANKRFEDAMRDSNVVLSSAAENARRVAEERRRQAIETVEATLAEQQLRAATAQTMAEESRARANRMLENARGRDVSEGIARVEQAIAGLEAITEEADGKVADLQAQLARLNETVPTNTVSGVVSLRDSATEADSALSKVIRQLEEAQALGALGLGIVGFSGRDQAIATAQFDALNAAQADFNKGLRDSALLLPEESAAIEGAAGAAFDYAEALDAIEDGQKRARSAADAFGKAAGGALLDIRKGAFDATEAVDRLIDSLFQALIFDPFTQAVSNFALGFFNPAGAAAGSSAGGGGTGVSASIQHQGGLVGTGPKRVVDPAVFIGAPRFHRGGLVPGERPIIAMEGEEVLRRDDPRHVRNRGGDAGDFIVNVIDQRGARSEPLEVSQRAVGRNEVDVLISESVARDIGRNGPISKAFQTRFGARPQGVG